MKRNLLLAGILLAAVSSWAQSDPVVMSVNGVDVHRSEFEYSYNKNNGDEVVDKKTVREYADLYANYKLPCIVTSRYVLQSLLTMSC